ncbi:MAG: dCTP deaminase, partial [Legionellales bacterium]|nr:dCTP deaminase [Legionellales bacterium]
MSIKSDTWITEMAEKHDMISPFVSSQVKESQGQKKISYGVSSYGYDVRCANEFMIFHNVNSTIVDPKNFDKSSFIK